MAKNRQDLAKEMINNTIPYEDEVEEREEDTSLNDTISDLHENLRTHQTIDFS